MKNKFKYIGILTIILLVLVGCSKKEEAKLGMSLEEEERLALKLREDLNQANYGSLETYTDFESSDELLRDIISASEFHEIEIKAGLVSGRVDLPKLDLVEKPEDIETVEREEILMEALISEGPGEAKIIGIQGFMDSLALALDHSLSRHKEEDEEVDLHDLLEDKPIIGEEVEFEDLGGTSTAQSTSPGLTYEDEADHIIITITMEFSTSGYSFAIDRVSKSGGDVIIYPNISAPARDSMNMQVISYASRTIKLYKKDLGDGPYNFIVEGGIPGEDSNRQIK